MGDTLHPAAPAVLDASATPVHFVEFAAPADLTPWVDGIAVLRIPPGAPTRRWRLIPDARARLWLPLAGSRWEVRFQPGAVAWSEAETPSAGGAAMIRFAPWAGRTAVARGRAAVARGRAAVALGRTQAITGERALPDSCDEVCAWLRRALPAGPPDERAMMVWRELERDPGVSAETLARRLGTSARSLRRLMHAASGCTLAQARQLERLRRALRLLRADFELSWTGAALAAGYCDQSHLNRAFARWVGMAPGRFFAEGHHHLNDVFAGRVEERYGPLRVVARGGPVLRASVPPRYPARHRLRSR